MRAALFGAQRNGAADLVGGGETLFWPEGKAKALLEPRSVLDGTRSPSPNNSTSTLSSSLGGGAADSTGVAVVSDSSAAVAAAVEATKWGAPGEPGGGGGGKEDWAGGCELPPIPTDLDMGVGGGDSWDAMLGNAAAAGQDQTFLNWMIGAAGDLDQPGPPLPVHQQPLLDNVGFGFPAADPLSFSLDPHLRGVGSDMSSPGAVSHATNSGGGGNKASSAFGLFSPESVPSSPAASGAVPRRYRHKAPSSWCAAARPPPPGTSTSRPPPQPSSCPSPPSTTTISSRHSSNHRPNVIHP